MKLYIVRLWQLQIVIQCYYEPQILGVPSGQLCDMPCCVLKIEHKLNFYHGILIKIQPVATVCRYLFTAKSLYRFRVSQHPSSGVLKTVTAASGTGHNIGTATSLQRGQI